MGLFDRRKPPTPTVVASASGIDVANAQETQELNLTRQPWQMRAYGYYDDVGEIHFPANYVGNSLAKIRLFAAEKPSATGDRPKPTTNEAIAEAVEKLKSPMGGQPALMRAMGINIFVAGEVFLIGKERPDGTQSWEAVSVNEIELRPGQTKPQRRRTPSSQPEELADGTLVVRVWRPHPRWSGLADSAMRTVMDECEKLLLLTRADKAAARSRIAGNGLLYIPNEVVPVTQQPEARDGVAVDAGQNPIYKSLVESMITPIRDESHPAGIVPITIFGPGEYADKIKYFTFDRPQAARAIQQREESIQRIATALDLPPEILTGKANLNHWTAWQVHEETFQAHLQPFVELICDGLTVGYLRPALINAGIKNPDDYFIWYDDSELVVRPDKGQTAFQLYEANVIDGAALRRETGFSEDDAMDQEGDEYKKRIGVILSDVQLALTGKPTPPEAPGAPGGPPVGGDRPTIEDKMTPPKAPEGVPSSTPKKTPTEKAKGPVTGSVGRPRADKPPIGVQLAQLDVELMTQLRAAASEAVVREMERAGARIRGKAQGDTEKTRLLDSVPNTMVASVLGPTAVQTLELNADNLFTGAFAGFQSRAQQLITAAQRQRTRIVQQFLDESRADEYADSTADLDPIYAQRDSNNARVAVAGLVGALIGFAVSKLYDPAPEVPTPGEGEFDGMIVPATIVRDAVNTAGGSLGSAPAGVTEPEDFGGVGTGGTTYAMFADNGIRTVGRRWVYGPAVRTPFASHEDLDGLEFDTWEDANLAVRDEDSWLGTDYYHPGDHRGCLCAVAPLVVKTPEPVEVPDVQFEEA